MCDLVFFFLKSVHEVLRVTSNVEIKCLLSHERRRWQQYKLPRSTIQMFHNDKYAADFNQWSLKTVEPDLIRYRSAEVWLPLLAVRKMGGTCERSVPYRLRPMSHAFSALLSSYFLLFSCFSEPTCDAYTHITCVAATCNTVMWCQLKMSASSV
jgi:hypothetical protein